MSMLLGNPTYPATQAAPLGACPPTRETVMSALDQNGAAINELKEVLYGLFEALQPVTRPTPESANKAEQAVPAADSSVMARILANTREIAAIASAVRAGRNALDL